VLLVLLVLPVLLVDKELKEHQEQLVDKELKEE
jgi:hypothetical protein